VISIDTLDYAKRLRECGFSEEQAEGQARALAAVMGDALATKQDLHELEARISLATNQLEARIEARFAQVDGRFARVDAGLKGLAERLDIRVEELEKRMELRLDARLADLERRMTMRLGGVMVAGLGIFSTLVKVL
jgi:predicted nuclease with TOPRIM domain